MQTYINNQGINEPLVMGKIGSLVAVNDKQILLTEAGENLLAALTAIKDAVEGMEINLDLNNPQLVLNTDDLEEIGKGEIVGNLITRIDSASTANVVYIGEAVPSTITSSGSWRIQRIDSTVAGMTTIQWADGNQNFDNIWDNRTTLSYS